MNELENALRDWDDPMGARDWELAERLIRMFREVLPAPVEDAEVKNEIALLRQAARQLRLQGNLIRADGEDRSADLIERQQQQVTALSQQVAELKREVNNYYFDQYADDDIPYPEASITPPTETQGEG